MLQRFYQKDALTEQKLGDTLLLSPDVHHHAIKVLRLKIDDEIILFSGQGGELRVKIIETKPKGMVQIIAIDHINRESPLQIHLAQGIAKGDKMDFIIQKAVELGCSQITPLITEKSQVRLDKERFEKKYQHWSNIIISAAEQCGLNILPKLESPKTLDEWLGQGHDNGIVFHPCDEKPSNKINALNHKISVLIGPESGLSQSEVQKAIANNFTLAQLGPRILRTETATVCAISLIQASFGDLPKLN